MGGVVQFDGLGETTWSYAAESAAPAARRSGFIAAAIAVMSTAVPGAGGGGDARPRAWHAPSTAGPRRRASITATTSARSGSGA